MCAYDETIDMFDSLEDLESKVDVDSLDFFTTSIRETDDGKIRMIRRTNANENSN